MLGQEIGNWRIESKLGEGGMGTVYLARHKTMGAPAALKMLSRTVSLEAKFRKRFVWESQAQAQLRHPGIAQVMDFIEQKEDLFLVIEYLPGGTLADQLENNSKITPMTALSWAQQALVALDYAHQRGVIHRDVKPSNLMFDEAGRLKVVDFGIALILDGRRATSGGVVGTPHYMSPEQIRRPLEVDHRTDVYAMGIVLYEMLAGRPPFDFEEDFDIRLAQVNERPKPLREQHPEVAEELEAIVLRALAKNPDERYSGCGEFARALAAFEKPVAIPLISTPPPLPPPVPKPAPVQQGSGAGGWQAAFVIALVLGLIVAAILGVQLSNLRESRDSLRTQLDSLQGRATGLQTRVNDLQAQLGNLQGQLGQKDAAIKNLGRLTQPQYWTPVVVDTFDTAGEWTVTSSPLRESWGSLNRAVSNGKYAWDLTVSQGRMQYQTLSSAFMGDGAYYLSIVTARSAGSEHAAFYLLLRRTGTRYYAFILEGGSFCFSLRDKEWKDLQQWTLSSAIHTGIGQTNRLSVLAEGSRYRLFINDTLVAEVTDNTLMSGYAGIGAGLANKGESARLEFDDFELRRRSS